MAINQLEIHLINQLYDITFSLYKNTIIQKVIGPICADLNHKAKSQHAVFIFLSSGTTPSWIPSPSR